MLKSTLIGLYAIAASAALLSQPACAAPVDHSNDQVTLAVNAVCTAEAHSKDDDTALNDSISVALTERDVYRVARWGDTGAVELELDRGRREIVPGGGGEYVAPVKEFCRKWTYQAGPQPDTPQCSVKIDPTGENCVVTLLNYIHNSNAIKVSPEDNNSAIASGVADNTLTYYAADDLLKGTPSPMSQQLKFRFDPGQKRVHVTGQGNYKFAIKGEGQGGATMTGTLQVLFTVDFGPPSNVDAIITPDPGYAGWIPAFGPAEGKPGGVPLSFTVELKDKKNPGQPVKQTAQFRFELLKTSQEPGRCLNSPDAGTDFDLKLLPEFNKGMAKVDPSGQSADSEKGLKKSSVLVSSLDSGAYGNLQATAFTSDGDVLVAHLQGNPDAAEIAIPKDDNHNHIAVAWLQQENVLDRNLPATWDGQDKPELNHTVGDGLSLYEKYRGLVHNGKPLRLKALARNLVVENKVGDSIRPGLKLFEAASGIHIVELSAGELPDDRAVNHNHGTAFVGVQHGLRLVSEALGPGIIGMAWPDRIKTSPGDCDRVAYNSDLSFIPAASRDAMLKTGVAHEFGHALGVQHHGDSPSGTTRENLVINNANVEIIGTDGKPITQRPFTLQGAIETKSNGGESSGDQDCVMRNSSFFQWVQRVDRNGALHYYAVPPTPPGTTFCSSPDGTGINAGDNTPISFFGNSAPGRGACTTHMHLRDY